MQLRTTAMNTMSMTEKIELRERVVAKRAESEAVKQREARCVRERLEDELEWAKSFTQQRRESDASKSAGAAAADAEQLSVKSRQRLARMGTKVDHL